MPIWNILCTSACFLQGLWIDFVLILESNFLSAEPGVGFTRICSPFGFGRSAQPRPSGGKKWTGPTETGSSYYVPKSGEHIRIVDRDFFDIFFSNDLKILFLIFNNFDQI
jgi:hypothetical protein